MTDTTLPAPDPTPSVRIVSTNYRHDPASVHDEVPYFYARASWSADDPGTVKLEWSRVPASTITANGIGLHHGGGKADLPVDLTQARGILESIMPSHTVANFLCALEAVERVTRHAEGTARDRLGIKP